MPALTIGGYRRRVVILDGFCGPGEYEGDEEGSPIVALRTYLEHSHRSSMEQTEFVFAFVDTEADRLRHLAQVAIPKLGPLPSNVTLDIVEGEFDETLTSLLDDLQERGATMAPTFAFVDPFGVSDTPMSLIERILEQSRSEVMVTVMLEAVNRFLEHPNRKLAERWDELLGDPRWRDLVDAPNRPEALGDFYAQQLGKSARYVTSFRMLDEGNRPIYDLFFATNRLEGLRKMKRAMWDVDPTGRFTFSDRYSVQVQPTLFGETLDTRPLRRALAERFHGRTAELPEIEEWVLTDTIYCAEHIKQKTLKPMEEEGLIEVIPSRPTRNRRKGTFPTGYQVRFL